MFFSFEGGVLLQMTGKVSSLAEGSRKISESVIGGEALAKFQAMMEAQGVTNEVAGSLCSAHVDYYSILTRAQHQTELHAHTHGTLSLSLSVSLSLCECLYLSVSLSLSQ